ncbi:hypothetical protein BIZ37_00075 [Photobacterium sp. BZF1]|uniref:hypothetical protein n=1 Tax=Photobacterium sp. BZF1 TaxID=1904457 RepID=UPI001653A9B1|nr:hypothetical protein [Photobacterium sp. BZF1]MBC7000934.1 hypothetical protein [Photobacterium sp. BZF1]
MTKARQPSSDDRGYITDPEMLRLHQAKNKAFDFRPSEDQWMLDVATLDNIDMQWFHTVDIGVDRKRAMLYVFTDMATRLSPNTFYSYALLMKSHIESLDRHGIEQVWPQLSVSYQNKLGTFFNTTKEIGHHVFDDELAFIERVGLEEIQRKILDPYKGALSEEEEDSLTYAQRLATDQMLKEVAGWPQVVSPTRITRLGTQLAYHLMRAILRRPCQLVAMKWDDVRKAGVPFSQAITSPLLAEDDVLHLRTFKGKQGEMRGFAERRSHPLTRELSSLVVLYHKLYWATMTDNLKKSGIVLTNEELTEVRKKSPVFPELNLFTTVFPDKATLFQSLSMKSKSYHTSAETMRVKLGNFFNANLRPHMRSDRIDPLEITVGNNRLRHTTLTNGSIQGLNDDQLAAIHGVTTDAVKPYIDLSHEARVRIDEALAGNHILGNFGRISVAETQQEPGFAVVNEFDEEVGILREPHSCDSCKAKGGKPLGCYPCENFKPLLEGDHEYQLAKAERRLELNRKNEADELVLRRWRRIILYIRATIMACSDRKMSKLEGTA